jgi:hypothetical protein
LVRAVALVWSTAANEEEEEEEEEDGEEAGPLLTGPSTHAPFH